MGWPTITGSEEMDERIDQSSERALAFLQSIQREDGSFGNQSKAYPGLTGLAAMCFLANGYIPGSGKYGDTLDRAIDWVLGRADENDSSGLLHGPGGQQMYSQGLCTLFLTEVSGMVNRERQAKIDALLPKAVQVILTAESNGGWTYAPTPAGIPKGESLAQKDWYAEAGGTDLSISGWQLMSLRGARLNGARVPNEAIDAAVKYVLRHHDEDEGTFGYRGKNDHAVTLTGAGILCLELCGQHDEARTRKSANYLMNNYDALSQDANGDYGLYYTAQGLFQLGGTAWQRFSHWMYTHYMGKQHADGSWRAGPNEELRRTTFITLAFAVPYRMLPIYQRDETVEAE
jgi:hypothetical protein